MGMDLAHQFFGGEGNPPLVILHGLLGSSRNWTSVAKELAGHFEVYAVDLRNHGKSPHAAEMTYAALAEDVGEFLAARELDRPFLLGHSLGGKTAMRLACDGPDRLRGLIVVDIAPRDYAPHFREEFAAMNELDLGGLGARREADEALAARGVEDWAMRQFLLTNLERDEASEGFRWQVNLRVLTEALPELAKSSIGENERFGGPTLFLRGENSDFVKDDDRPAITRHFPASQLMTIADAAHNVHVQNKAAFVSAVAYFAEDVMGGASKEGTGGSCGI